MAVSSTPPSAPRSLVIPLAPASRRWRRLRAQGDERLTISALGVLLEHERCPQPLRLALGSVAVAAIEGGAARPESRFPILRRLGPNAVVPREEGIEGWLWTRAGGSALTMLGDEDVAPNLALVLAQPLGEETIAAAFDADLQAEVAARSPLGAPSLYGLLLHCADLLAAERAFAKVGLLRPLTDREVPKTLRRSLPTDKPADPAIRVSADSALTARSVAPPGLR